MESEFNQSKDWIYKAVGLLSINGGFISCITFESFLHNPVGYVTGNMTFAASYLASLDFMHFCNVLSVLLAFLSGAVLSGIILPHNNFTRNSRYNIAFAVQAMLIAFGMVGLLLKIPMIQDFLAIALGLQNGSTTFYGKSIIRTTHMTGAMTDLGILLAHRFLKKHDVPLWRIMIYLSLLLGFFLGSLLGILAFRFVGYYGLCFSVLICIAMIKFDIIKIHGSDL